jgi:long-chain acyl-CoA synthetase
LYEHEAVREAAVVGIPDAYRGETVEFLDEIPQDGHRQAPAQGAACPGAASG